MDRILLQPGENTNYTKGQKELLALKLDHIQGQESSCTFFPQEENEKTLQISCFPNSGDYFYQIRWYRAT